MVSKCCDLLLELVNLRVLAKTHKVQKSKGNDRIMKKFWKSIIYGMIWMWLKFGDDRVTSKTLATRPDPYPPPSDQYSFISIHMLLGLQLVLTCLSNKTNIGINVLHALASKIKVSCWIYQIESASRCIADCIAVHRGILEKRYGFS